MNGPPSSIWADLYFACVLLDGLVSLIEPMLRGQPTFVLSILSVLASVVVLVQSLRGVLEPRGLLAATSTFELAVLLAVVIAVSAGIRAPALGASYVLSYVPLSLLAFAGLARGDAAGRAEWTSLARLACLAALVSATLVALAYPGHVGTLGRLASRVAWLGAGLSAIAFVFAETVRERFLAVVGLFFNGFVALGWTGAAY